MRIVAIFGAPAVAGYTVAMRIVAFFILPAWGLSNAAATLVGQNLGAARPDRAEQAVWRTGVYTMVFLAALGVFFFVFADPVIRIFVSDPVVIRDWRAKALRTFSCGNIAFAWVMVTLQAFNGAGDTLTPTFVYFFGFWVFELPLAWWLAHGFHLREEGRIFGGRDRGELDCGGQPGDVPAGTVADAAGLRADRFAGLFDSQTKTFCVCFRGYRGVSMCPPSHTTVQAAAED